MSESEGLPPVPPSLAPCSPVASFKTRGTEEDSNSCTSIGKNESPKTKTNIQKPTSTAGAPLPLVSTPARDQSAILAKRMQNLQLIASPQTFTAASPMRTFSTTPHKHCDLTPVMKNTGPDTSTAVDLDLDLELDFDLDMLDSRGGANDELNTAFSARPLHPGSMLPPLAKRGLFPAPKRSFEDEDTTPIAIEIPTDTRPPLRAPELAFLPPVEEPVPFPGKSLTFTSMQQYERRTQREPPVPSTTGLTPYQPSRQDPGLVDIPQEALNSIFTTRRSNSQSLSTPDSTFSEEDDGSAMQGLFPAIPLEERQWSIPSIRMAHQIGGSVTSCTTYTDEDDESLLMYRDDASLSSYGSYSHLTGADGRAPSNVQAIFMMGSSDQQVAFDTNAPQQLDSLDDDEEEDEVGMDTGDDGSLPNAEQTALSRYHQLRRREKRKEKREHKALEWLRTVKAGKDEVAEAASSKFLTRKNDIISATPQGLYDKPQKRLSAAAVETRTFAFLAKDLEDDSCGGDDNDSFVQAPAVYQQLFAPTLEEMPAPIS